MSSDLDISIALALLGGKIDEEMSLLKDLLNRRQRWWSALELEMHL